MLLRGLREFNIREFPLDPAIKSESRSIFDLPILVKKSVPTEQYFEEKVLKILDVSLSEIKKYVNKFCNDSEAAPILGEIIMEQFDKYLKFISYEKNNWSRIVNDVLFITTCDNIADFLEKAGLDALSKEVIEKCQQIRK